MATDAQIRANQQNAQHSTGATTPEGQASSSRNRLTFGLYTREDYVKREERELYEEFCRTLHTQLTPSGLMEEAFAAEIVGAHWRLRRCAAAEADLADFSEIDPYIDDTKEKPIRSIERARAAAHCALNRATKQLRTIQTERLLREHLELGSTDDTILAESQKLMKGYIDNNKRLKGSHASSVSPQSPNGNGNAWSMGSNCNPPEAEPAPQPQTPRNAPCPCNSGQKFKRCCGINAAPVLG